MVELLSGQPVHSQRENPVVRVRVVDPRAVRVLRRAALADRGEDLGPDLDKAQGRYHHYSSP
jgi:hypothetical protein